MVGRRAGAVACVGVLVACVGMGTSTAAGAQTDTGDSAAAAVSSVDDFLAVQADGGTLAKDGGELTLTLDDVESRVGVFADDDPSQPSANLPVRQLVKKWDALGLDDDAPNAAVTVLDGTGRGTASAYTLSDPEVHGDAVSFTATPAEDLASDADVAPALTEHLAAASGPVPEQFGQAAALIDPVGSTGLIQYCTAVVTNNSGTVVVGAVIGALPIVPPTVVIPNASTSQVKTAAPVGCNVTIAFTTGARTWSLTMSAVTGKSNTVGASSNVAVVPGDRGSARWNCTFTLN